MLGGYRDRFWGRETASKGRKQEGKESMKKEESRRKERKEGRKRGEIESTVSACIATMP